MDRCFYQFGWFRAESGIPNQVHIDLRNRVWIWEGKGHQLHWKMYQSLVSSMVLNRNNKLIHGSNLCTTCLANNRSQELWMVITLKYFVIAWRVSSASNKPSSLGGKDLNSFERRNLISSEDLVDLRSKRGRRDTAIRIASLLASSNVSLEVVYINKRYRIDLESLWKSHLSLHVTNCKHSSATQVWLMGHRLYCIDLLVSLKRSWSSWKYEWTTMSWYRKSRIG